MKDQNSPTTSPFNSIRAVDYTVILVRDMAAMRRFYEDVLCFPLTRELSLASGQYRGEFTRAAYGCAEVDQGLLDGFER